ncbi:type II toxin-antitoxin system RelE/ParE family toxin [Bacteroides sp. 51]|uniref:type II toxin-antitoxin system RelE/ParE family toxin n=1 Tax=Bacteroides sp. 51 TaxID=2302938 RepID=UPI0013D100AC|nr:type II toxin-antitoxin system RelE/ParE family toxin [Bacteroides sp. 51]NDV84345.1 type II toxin-antitoxin system RelE/ParE family toxin [Bacteroides sp. 51]
MEITKIYWREDALNNLKDIIALYHRQGKKVADRIIDEITRDVESLRKRPYLGYIEASMMGQPQKIFSHYITSRQLKILYYTENDTMYIIDFWDN